MRKALVVGLIIFCFATSLNASEHPASAAGGCSLGKSAAGAGVGLVIGTLLLPGVGSFVALVLGGGATCLYDWMYASGSGSTTTALSP
jgi:hypothetical protein